MKLKHLLKYIFRFTEKVEINYNNHKYNLEELFSPILYYLVYIFNCTFFAMITNSYFTKLYNNNDNIISRNSWKRYLK